MRTPTPPYDEYTVAYRDRSAALHPRHAAARDGIFSPTIVLDGRIAGIWTRRLAAGAVTIALKPFTRLAGANARRVADEAVRYGRSALVVWIPPRPGLGRCACQTDRHRVF